MTPITLQLHDVLARPLVPIVQEIGLRGLPFDATRRDDMVRGIRDRLATVDAKLTAAGVREQNSPYQLQRRLVAMGVPLTTLTKGAKQFKVDLEVLGRLNWEHNTRREAKGKVPLYPFLKDLVDHAKLSKAAENLTAYTPCFDGRLRTSLQACATKTARYASAAFGRKTKPGYCPVDRVWGTHGFNSQNVPRRDEVYDINVKECFVAEPGWSFAELDHKTLELRIEAYETGAVAAAERLEGGLDIHSRNARLMFELCEDENVPKPRRTLAKNFRYALRGGGGDRAVQIALAKGGEFCELVDCARWRKAIFDDEPETPTWIDRVRTALYADRMGQRVVRNAFGRPRILLGPDPLKDALAFIISGTAADVMNLTLLRLATYEPAAYAAIVAQLHDAFLLYAPTSVLAECAATVRGEMERPVWAWDRFVSFPTDLKMGTCWGKLEEVA